MSKRKPKPTLEMQWHDRVLYGPQAQLIQRLISLQDTEYLEILYKLLLNPYNNIYPEFWVVAEQILFQFRFKNRRKKRALLEILRKAQKYKTPINEFKVAIKESWIDTENKRDKYLKKEGLPTADKPFGAMFGTILEAKEVKR